MKIAVVYTGLTPELKEMVDGALARKLQGREFEILSYKDPSIIQEANERGCVTQGCARSFWTYMSGRRGRAHGLC